MEENWWIMASKYQPKSFIPEPQKPFVPKTFVPETFQEEKPETSKSSGGIWDFLTTPLAPEVTEPTMVQKHPYVTEFYNRFVRPVSSPLNAAITGATGPILRIGAQFAPGLLGAAGTGLGIYGAAKTIEDIPNVMEQGFTPENVGNLAEHGGMAAALPFGANMLRNSVMSRIGAKAAIPEIAETTTLRGNNWPKMPSDEMSLPEFMNTQNALEKEASTIGQGLAESRSTVPVKKPHISAQEFSEYQKSGTLPVERIRELGAFEEAPKSSPKYKLNPETDTWQEVPSEVKGPVYHGTRTAFNEFDTTKNQPHGLFPGMTKFTENPKYSELYSMGKTEEGMTREIKVTSQDRPNTIAANIHASNVLDLTKPIPSNQIETLRSIFPKELQGQLSNEYIFDILKHSKQELPFDAIRFNEHGNVNWAVPSKTRITSPSGAILQQGEISPQAQAVIEKVKTNPKAPVTPQDIKDLTQELPKIDLRRNPFNEAWNFGRTTMTSYDLSAPLRQGLGLAHRKEYWGAFDDMFKSLKSEDAFNLVQDSILENPLFKGQVVNGKEIPSFAERAGIQLTDLLTKREEAFLSSYAEKIPGVKASNRAYIAFLNKVRADTFTSLIKQAEGMGLKPQQNDVLAKAIAEYVNTASGRSKLAFDPKVARTIGKYFNRGEEVEGLQPRSLEKYAGALNNLLFSPRLIQSRLKMLNPNTYVQIGSGLAPEEASFIRRQYLQSLFDMTGAGRTLVGLGQLAGGTVESDPRSSDFGKLKVGNTRLDPYGGMQQYVVAASKLMSGQSKSTKDEQVRDMGAHFGSPTRLSTAERFAQSKAHPMIGFALSMLEGKDFSGQPVQVPNEIAKMYIPMLIQDVFDLAMDNPALLPLAIPGGFGMGLQTYGGK